MGSTMIDNTFGTDTILIVKEFRESNATEKNGGTSSLAGFRNWIKEYILTRRSICYMVNYISN